MKDYSFGDKEYQQEFILNYKIIEDGSKIRIYYANGKTKEMERFWQYYVEKRMVEQINKAYDVLTSSKVDYSSMSLLRNILRTIDIKSKEKDITKNKIFIDNLDVINENLRDRRWTLQFPLYLQDKIIWRRQYFDVVDANHFSLKEVTAIVDGVKTFHKTPIGLFSTNESY